MAIVKDNDCVSCERCVNCGRGDFEYAECDRCGVAEEEMFYLGKNTYCIHCLFQVLKEMGKIVPIDDEDETYMYDFGGYQTECDIKETLKREYRKVVLEND